MVIYLNGDMAEIFVNLKGTRVRVKDILQYEDAGYRNNFYVIKIATVNGNYTLSYKEEISKENMLKKLDGIFQTI